MMSPVTSAAAVVAIADDERAEADRPGADGRGRRDGVPRAVGELLRLAPAVVGVDDALRVSADRVDEPRPVVVEPAGVVADDAVAVLAAALGEMLGDAPATAAGPSSTSQSTSSPIFCLDLLRRVGDDLLLEALLHPASVQQVHDPADPHRVVEVVVAALLHLEQDAIDVGHPQLEVARQVLLIHRRAAARRRRAWRSRPASSASRSCTTAACRLGERRRDAERVEQLQLDASGRVERRLRCSARAPRSGSPARHAGSPCLARSASRALTGKISGAEARAARRALRATNVVTSSTCASLVEDVDLVDDDDDLLAPAADLLEERALGLGERPVGGGHEQHQVGARHELGGDPLVLADDRVGARACRRCGCRGGAARAR